MMFDNLSALREIGVALQSITRRARPIYKGEVDAIIREGCRDPQRIERTLDCLLDFCHDPEILLLYRRLCRYYLPLDPAGTAFYVNAYREMWDTQEEAETVPIPAMEGTQ